VCENWSDDLNGRCRHVLTLKPVNGYRVINGGNGYA